MNLRKYIDGEISREEALELVNVKGSKMVELLAVANEVREKYCGNKLSYCTITNAKSGRCSENCRFCAQSAHYNTNVSEYDVKNKETLFSEYKECESHGSSQFGFVTSGRSVKKGTDEFERFKELLEEVKKDGDHVEICGSIGLVSYEDLMELKKHGLRRFHHNLQTSENAYENIVATTHGYKEKIEVIKNAKKAGLNTCCGGIIGMGESWEDRIDMAFMLKELDVDGIPLNILNPIPGTPMGNRPLLQPEDFLKTVAIYRLINKNKTIKVAAGRENILKDFMGTAFLSGANSLFIGGYLTRAGRSIDEDLKFVADIKRMWGAE
jgi:biotin synthase